MNYSSCMETVSLLNSEVRNNSYNKNFIKNIYTLGSCCEQINYNKPMVWIGIYIAIASLFCVLSMMADLFHGFRNRKFWFPCKYFTLNTTSITVITVAMKLPVDLNTPMDGLVDLIAKLGSLLFMSTMMANLMPSLASMNNKELLANGTGLVILVVTLIANTMIELDSGILYMDLLTICVWLGALVCSLMILISTAITIPTIKQILEFKYQVAHAIASNDKQPQLISDVDELTQHVKIYWVMARTSNPQYVMATTPLCCAASVISVTVAVVHLFAVSLMFINGYYTDYMSDYEWSMLVIVITQCLGIVVGNIAPLCRCFGALGFKLSFKWTIHHFKVFKVEHYWIKKLSTWKESHVAIPSSSRLLKAFVYNLKNLILSVCIKFQKVIIVTCKMIELIPTLVILVMYSLYHMKYNVVHESNKNDTKEDISNYILRLQDETKLSKRTLKRISNSLNRLMQKAKDKHMSNNLMQLLQKSTGFEGVESFNSDQVQPLTSVELNCWCLPVVTLTCIAIALPNICKDIVDCLINSVGESLWYARLVDESLSISCGSVNIQKLVNNSWDEVYVNCRWLDQTLKGNAYKGKTAREILELFNHKAKEVVVEIQNHLNEGAGETSHHKLIAANSMYHITQTLMLKNQRIIEQNNEDQIFHMLSTMIADIFSACFTNLPQVIAMKCHERVIEKREASVEAAAELLGRSKEIINNLQTRELPSMDRSKITSIEEWHNYSKALP